MKRTLSKLVRQDTATGFIRSLSAATKNKNVRRSNSNKSMKLKRLKSSEIRQIGPRKVKKICQKLILDKKDTLVSASSKDFDLLGEFLR